MITDKQRADRARRLYATDLAPILGMSRYGVTGADVQAEKLRTLTPRKPTTAMQLGNLVEEPLITYAKDLYGPGTANAHRVCKGLPLGAHLDLLHHNNEITECKVEGVLGPHVGNWGAEHTDEIPQDVILQCHVQMMSVGAAATVAHVIALLGGRGICEFRIARNNELCDIIAERVQAWWYDHVEQRRPVPDQVPSLDVLKRIRREPESVIDVDAEGVTIVEEWERVAADRRALEKAEQDYKAAVLDLFGDAEAARLPDGRLLTYLTQARKNIDAAKLHREYPEVGAACQTTTSYRTLRIKKARTT